MGTAVGSWGLVLLVGMGDINDPAVINVCVL